MSTHPRIRGHPAGAVPLDVSIVLPALELLFDSPERDFLPRGLVPRIEELDADRTTDVQPDRGADDFGYGQGLLSRQPEIGQRLVAAPLPDHLPPILEEQVPLRLYRLEQRIEG